MVAALPVLGHVHRLRKEPGFVAGFLALSLLLLLFGRAKLHLSVASGLLKLHHCAVAAGAGGNSSSSDGVWPDGAGPARQPRFEPVPAGNSSSDIALCLTTRDDHCDIREWVLHHATIGVGKIYVFDTGSAPPMDGVLADVIASGLVEHHYLAADAAAVANRSINLTVATNSTAGPIQLTIRAPLPETPEYRRNWQVPVFGACLRHFGARHRWMGFIDSDEYVLLQPGVPSLPALLERYSSYGGVRLHWWLFASGPHLVRPSGGVMASYTSCCPRNSAAHKWTKPFVQPARVIDAWLTHSFTYKEGWNVVDTLKRPAIDTPAAPYSTHGLTDDVTYEGAVLAHYVTRSIQDFEKKTLRGGGGGKVRTLPEGFGYLAHCREICEAAVPLGRALAMRWDLALGTPARCRPGVDVARDMLSQSNETAVRDWLQLLERG